MLALDQAFASIEHRLRRLRDEDAALLTFADEGPTHGSKAGPSLVALPEVVTEGPADRLVGVVARLSLDVQERVEVALERRRSAERPLAGSSRSERMRVPLAGARDVAMRVSTDVRAFGRAAGLRLAANRALRFAAVVTFAGVLAVQVLGIGRSSQGQPAASDTVSAVVTPHAGGVGSPTVPVAPTAPPASSTDVTGERTLGDVGPAPERLAPPVALRVAAIGVAAPVVTVGLEPDDSMEIPADVRTVGWYEPIEGWGVVPGESGTAVIAGHVDSRTQGRGAFWSLRELVPGDVIDVEHADGTVSRWRVESVVRHPKTDLPIRDIFTFEGDERLALITCGGEFDRSAGSYLDNYVVTAVPLRTAVTGSGQTLPVAP